MAVRLLERWLDRNARSDTLLESLPHRLPAVERARVQHLFYGVLREWSRLEGAAARYVSRAPRPVLR